MNRKHFITSASALLTAAALPVKTGEYEIETVSDFPAYLKKGDTIGITAPAGYITLEEIQPAVKLMESWGFKIKVGDTISKKDFTFGGSDEERLKDFQHLLD